MPLYIAQSGDLDRCHGCLTDSQTLKDRAIQLLKKYKSGALVTQLGFTKCKLSSFLLVDDIVTLSNFRGQQCQFSGAGCRCLCLQ